ncbi:hypothetical protein EQV77_15450 [Halobacillus fulvus]|nr:hypothetical protein EQV77_15450 [Halobacillus fulvus]
MKNPGRWNAWGGFLLLIVWQQVFYISRMDLALGFVFLILVPLLLEEVVRFPEKNRAEGWLSRVAPVSLPFAAAGTISVTLPQGTEAGWWAGVWFFYTLLIAFGGGMRWLGRGARPVEELVIDVGLLYIAAGGALLVVSQAGWASFFSTAEITLMVVHLHYAGFVLTLVTGFFGRYRSSENARHGTFMVFPYQLLSTGVLVGPLLVTALFVQNSTLQELITGGYILVLIWLCLWWMWISVDFKVSVKLSLQGASVILTATVVLSFLHSQGLAVQSVSQMVAYHGLWSAFGFSLLATLAWRGVHPSPRHAYTTFPVSRLRKKGDSPPTEWIARHEYVTGLVHDWREYRSGHFEPLDVDFPIRSLFTHTDRFRGIVRVEWLKGFRKLSSVCAQVMRKAPPVTGFVPVDGEVVSLFDQKDGRDEVRAWMRKTSTSNARLFSLFYSYHKTAEETFMNIALPLPLGMLTSVLRVRTDEKKALIVTTRRRKVGEGDEGIYLSFGDWTIRTPLNEWCRFSLNEEGKVTAVVYLYAWRLPFLKVEYVFEEKVL